MKGIIEVLNGQLLTTVDDHVYFPKNAKISPEIDQEPKKKRARKNIFHQCHIRENVNHF